MYKLSQPLNNNGYATFTDPTVPDDSNIYYVGDDDMPKLPKGMAIKLDLEAVQREHEAIAARIALFNQA